MGMLFNDISSAFMGLGYVELAVPTGFLLWLFVIMMTLKKADPKQWLQGWLYSGFAVFVGFILVIALPQRYLPPISLAKVLFWFVIFWSISFARWSLAMSHAAKVVSLGKRNADKTKKRS